MSQSLSIGPIPRVAESASASTSATTRELSWVERALLGLGIFEIPLQIDSYLMFHESDASLGAVGGINISIMTLCLAGLYWLWMGQVVNRRDINERPVRLAVGVPMLVYIGIVCLSSNVAIVPLLSLFDVALLAQAWLIYLFVANRVQTRNDVWFLVGCFAATLGFQSLLIFGLAAGGDALIDTSTQFGPLNLSVWADGRPCGSMQSAVLAGSVMALLWLPIGGMLLADAPRQYKTIAAVALLAGLLAILLTQTRGAILTTAFGSLVVCGCLLGRGWLPRWIITAALIGSLIGAYPLYRVIEKRVRGDDGGSAEARIHLATIAIEMISDRPVLGYGAGNCHLAGQRYADQGSYRSEWYYTIHNKYLLTWIETGLFGMLAFLCVLGNGLRQGFLTWRARDRSLSPLGIALIAGILGHMLHMTFDVFNSRTQVQVLWVILGLAAAVHRILLEEKRQKSNDRRTKKLAEGIHV